MKINRKSSLTLVFPLFFFGVFFFWGSFAVWAQLCNMPGEICTTIEGYAGTCTMDQQSLVFLCLADNSHRGCLGESCVSVSGQGANLCDTNADCATAVSHHKICQNKSCVTTEGSGTDQCQNNSDCGGGTTNPAGGGNPSGGGSVNIPNPLGNVDTFAKLVDRIAGYFFEVGIPIGVIMIIYAAYMYLTAAGSEDKISKAHKALTYAMVGIAILLLAKGLTSLVAELLGAS